ncbi:MAG: HesA/MoeB/ThiF family protein [Alphaproteobacteria bacterium]
MQRYDRQLRIKEFGEDGQKKLLAANICVVGAGGLGSQLLPIFVGAGVGKITIIDFDDVSLTNLHRQTLYREEQIGQNKAVCAKKNLQSLNHDVQMSVMTEPLTPENAADIFAEHDLILDATDNFLAKFLINRAAGQAQKPLVYASVRRFEGQVGYFEPHQGYGLQSFAKEPTQQQAESEYLNGVLPSQVSIIAALQAQLAIGYLVGGILMPPLGELVIFDGISLTMRKLAIPQKDI